MTFGRKQQIHGWKEIASFLDRDERTAKRWEKQRGLPVRRIPGAGRANVYIVVEEVEQWLAGAATASEPLPSNATPALVDDRLTSQEQEADASSPSADVPEPFAAQTLLSAPLPTELGPAAFPEPMATEASPDVPSAPRIRARWRYWAPALVVLSSVLCFLVLHGVRSRFLTSLAPAAPVHSAHTPSPEARALYLRGIALHETRTPAALLRAQELFGESVHADPSFGAAYAALAENYLLLREYSSYDPERAYQHARVAATEALRLDPNLAEAETVLGFITFFHDWDPAAATLHFESALRLDPNCALAHHWYGSMLTHQRHFTAALHQLDIAQQLDPSSVAIVVTRGYALGLSGHREEAIELLRGHDTAGAHRLLAQLDLLSPANLPEYIQQRLRFEQLREDPGCAAKAVMLQKALQAGGVRGLWTTVLTEERRHGASLAQPTFEVASAEAALGQRAEALRDLERMADTHDPAAIGMAIDPNLRIFEFDPRYRALCLRVGVTPDQN